MYLRGSKGFPYKRRKIHPANLPPNPLDDVLERRILECACQDIPCSGMRNPLSKNPSYTPISGSGLVQALHSIRMPRVFIIGVDDDNRETEARVRKRCMKRSPRDAYYIDDDEKEEDDEKAKEEEMVLIKDPTSRHNEREGGGASLSVQSNLKIQVTGNRERPKVEFDPTDLGSFPPRASDLMLFSEAKRKREPLTLVEDLDDEELPQPERENPPDLMRPPDPVRPARHLRLQYFDNPTLELRHPSVDLKEAFARGEPGLWARSRFFSVETQTLTWKRCLVVAHDDKNDFYTIRWMLDEEELGSKQKQVTRLNLIFDFESEGSFIMRRLHAEDLRERIEADLRCVWLIEELPFVNYEHMDELQMVRIMNVAGWDLCFVHLNVVKECFEEVRIYTHRAVNNSILEYEFATNMDARERFVALNVLPVGRTSAPLPRKGCVPLEFSSQSGYWHTRTSIVRNLVVADDAFLRALQHFHSHLDIELFTLVSPILYEQTKPWKLSNFERAQRAHVDDQTSYIKYEWPSRIVGFIEDLAPVVADLSELQRDRLMKFVTRLNLTMSEQLQELVLQSVEEFKVYLDFYRTKIGGIEQVTVSAKPEVHPTLGETRQVRFSQLTLQFGEGNEDDPKEPLFRLDLVVDNNRVVFRPALQDFVSTMLALLDDMVQCVRSVEGLRSRLRSLFESSKSDVLAAVPLDDTRLEKARMVIKEVLELNFLVPLRLEQMYNIFQDLIDIDVDEYLKNYQAGNHSLEDYEAEINRFLKVSEHVKLRTDKETFASMFLVDCTRVREKLGRKAKGLAYKLCTQIMTQTTARNEIIRWKYQTMETRLQSPINTPEELDMMTKYLAEIKFDVPQRRVDVQQSQKVWDMLARSNFIASSTDEDSFWITVSWPQRLQRGIDEVEQSIIRKKMAYAADHSLNTKQLMADIKALSEVIQEYMLLGQIDAWEERIIYCQEIEDKLKRYLDLATLYNTREEILGCFITEYTHLEQLEKQFELHGMLWHTCNDFLRAWPGWMDGPFQEIDGEVMVANMDKWFRASAKCSKMMTNVETKIVGEELKRRIAEFQVNVPFIAALRAPGMRDRHWKRLTDNLGFEVSPTFTTRKFIDLKMPQYTAQCEEVSEVAGKEYGLERALDRMQTEWIGINIEYKGWHNTGTSILCNMDDLQTLLDDQLLKTQSMQASPYVAPFEDRVKVWLGKLTLMKKVIDEWLKCQVQWTYLEPIFTSEDIMQQMPSEGRRFMLVDKKWRNIMKRLMLNPDALSVGNDEEIYTDLIQNNRDLEVVQAGLNDYLETKRLAFPRFYFLSNDELLEILAETKDPLRVQPFLKKIFEGIHSIEFTPNLFIVAMLSEEGERVVFDTIVNPKAAQGAVEKWFTQVEATMRTSLRSVASDALKAYTMKSRVDWLLDWPGQVAICVSQMQWTTEVTESIREGTLKERQEECTKELQAIVNKVRGKLTKLERKTFGALIVLDVHARDVVKSLADAEVKDETDFDWICQLRYYFEEESVMVRMINAGILYAWEYLGNSPRLVITPLTDRCYRTLTGALHLNLGGAPEGPAGTGKTETTKDLAKAVAMQCVVFNCSDGLDYLAMGKFFKGLASAGAWSCFDEFNRIDLEVLSVIAQQILTIQRAKAAMLKAFEFEGTRITLKPSCSVFITMNPGYAGRSELPDNLKALFRTVAMMVPDYALIAEITLYSTGYLEARELAGKLVATYRLCSEQLSSQNHYDYGMRAVISVLRAAGAVKQKYPEEREDVLMLRSLKDVNLPKFLAHDIPLFEGILKDLFPGVTLPPPDYKDMQIAIEANCLKFNLQPTPFFLEKIFQLYEMILVRHGLMLVGYSFGAKTECYRVLAAALSDLQTKSLELITRYFVLNPKSIYIGQLYGQFDPVSHEWTDGILAKIFRDAATDPTPDRKWIIFDGPVDAVWIENMNTVLDDNKKLCLMSGEIIQMTQEMNLIFEVQDLAAASPATVSRCGMVYTEPSAMGFWPLVKSWEKRTEENFHNLEEAMPIITSMIQWLIEPCVDFVRKQCKELIATSPISLVNSFLNMFESQLDEFKAPPVKEAPRRSVIVHEEESTFNPAPKGDDVWTWIQCLFMMSVVWSIGATIDMEGRKKFDKFFRKLLAKEDDIQSDLSAGLVINQPDFSISLPYPAEKTVYDFCFLKVESSWKEWITTVDTRPPPHDCSFTDIIVPTTDTARYSFLFVLLVTHQKHVLFGGPTGTGKTVYIKHELGVTLDKEKYRNILMTFSAQTSANQTQDIIDSKLDKRKKGVYGPPVGSKCVIFVDDLNMPALEVYGAQPPIEILRQWMDHGGWYNREENTFRALLDIEFAAAMGPPGGGRNAVTPRFIRHFNVLSILDFDDSSLSTVFTTIMDWWIRKARLPQEVLSMGNVLVHVTIDVFRAIQRELLPTPSKSHYIYNMRDISKVFQGVCMVGVTVGKKGLVRLWCHECLRVFHDRLVDDEDRYWFLNYLKVKVEKDLLLASDYLFAVQDQGDNIIDAMKNLTFGDVMDTTAIPKRYEDIEDQNKLLRVLEEGLKEYNAQTRNTMPLVLFSYAAQHVLRISRIIRQPFGNALLVGVGGGGRQSLTRLATFMAGYGIFQVEIFKLYGLNEWREDLKSVLRRAGAQNVSTVFLINDTQLKMEQFLEDINNILNTGEVPNLFPKDEMMIITEALKPRAKRAGKDGSMQELYEFFVDQCRINLHLVICMSPFGSAFRTRLRMFPSLVTCCTIDWFSEWPEEALRSVASRFVAEIDIEESLHIPIRDMCMMFHQQSARLSKQYRQEQQRDFYVTPTSYLNLLSTYNHLLNERRSDINTRRSRYKLGLSQLMDAEGQVKVMQYELEALQPTLLKTARETLDLLKVVEADREEAHKTREIVEAEETVAKVKAEEANLIKEECEADLEVAMPALNAALSALDTLTKADVTEVKAMKHPPKPVKLVMEAVCILKEIPPRRVPDPKKPGLKMNDFWGPAQNLLADTSFLSGLRSFDKDHIQDNIMKMVQPYLRLDDFDPQVVKKASKAAYGLCCWIRAMDQYHTVIKVVAPKQAKLAAANAEFEVLQAALEKKKELLSSVEQKVQKLEQNLQMVDARKSRLEAEVQYCQQKLARAEKLIGGLAGEKVRWADVINELSAAYHFLTGDTLLASGYIAYLGPVTLNYRERLLRDWSAACREKLIPCSQEFVLAKLLSSPVTIRDWVIAGLPNDGFSIDNAIVMNTARRWPLLIDPQGQGNKFIKNKEKANNIQVMKLSDLDFARKLEMCITFGYPLLIENIGEELDPTLEPLLVKAVFKSAGMLQIRLGDSTIAYNQKFKLYLTTKLRNPHYAPEISVKVSLLNLAFTPEGLEYQLLGEAVRYERPDLEEQKTQLVVQGAENQRQLKNIEDRIIERSAVKTEAKIDDARKGYVPVARHVGKLFFTISSLASIDPMYQYSLTWYLQLFRLAMIESPKSAKLNTRIESLNDYFTFLLYSNICRSLFEKDKMLLSFLIGTSLLLMQGKMTAEELRFLAAGPLTVAKITPDNPVPWLANKQWIETVEASQMQSFARLIIIRLIRPDKMVTSVSSFILETMGRRYIEPPGFDLAKAYHDSYCLSPLIFLLTPGSDPMAALLKFSEEMGRTVNSISLGQGQGPKAAALIHRGDWNGIKMTNEAPKGLRANMMQSYQSYPLNDPKFFNVEGPKGPIWRKLLFGLCFFHAAVQERVKFGPLGWNIPYQFSDPDLKISMRQLQSFLLDYPDSVPFKALLYLTGECNYGGRVTDAQDRRTLNSILATIYTPRILNEDYWLSRSGIYFAPSDGSYEHYVEHIKQFPLIATPEAFGLHDNADITKDQKESEFFCSALLSTQSSTRLTRGKSKEEVVFELAEEMSNSLPPDFDIELTRYKYPVLYMESMNSVLVQEMVRFNRLISVIRSSLITLRKALKGQVVMSPDMEALAHSIYIDKMPAMWAAVSYPTTKPLKSYHKALLQRLAMLRAWLENGPPVKFWLGGFFFTQAFLTGVLQNFARKYTIPIDTLCFEFRCLPKDKAYDTRPEDGVYVEGMFIEGARWDDENMVLTESRPKELYSPAPMIWLMPVEQSKKNDKKCYHCPLYRTTERRGVLATTGHSSNFVLMVDLPTGSNPDHWVRRGVAALLSLGD
ncbi:hypothetical protein R1sor_021178 [Riccia sorocarpa]|uniref:Dynein heavy chain n=1 Tax=Riccia sorocarpa TaxID=122646 RepID=A0ABD3GI40_9MARC